MKKLILIFILMMAPLAASAAPPVPRTFWSWMGNSTLDGASIPVGAVITAYDPNNVLCGTFTVTTRGQFSFDCRGDDPDTATIDEGGVPGDSITFYINGFVSTIVGGSNVWQSGFQEVNISATSGCHTNAACDDGNACNGVEICNVATGVCAGGAILNCDDGNICTDDSCNAASGCVNSNNTASCDDGKTFTSADRCSGGTCTGTPDSCPDADICQNGPGVRNLTTGACEYTFKSAETVCRASTGSCDPEEKCTGSSDACPADVGHATASDANCNGVDDDCNGIADDTYVGGVSHCGLVACATTGTQVCEGGTVRDVCVPLAGTAETCNGLDDDCDGTVDNGVVFNACGTCGAVPAENCTDGTDNDCDHLIDSADTDCTPTTCAGGVAQSNTLCLSNSGTDGVVCSDSEGTGVATITGFELAKNFDTDPSGSLIFSDGNKIYKINSFDGTITQLATGFTFHDVLDIAATTDGVFVVTSEGVYKITNTSVTTVFTGYVGIANHDDVLYLITATGILYRYDSSVDAAPVLFIDLSSLMTGSYQDMDVHNGKIFILAGETILSIDESTKVPSTLAGLDPVSLMAADGHRHDLYAESGSIISKTGTDGTPPLWGMVMTAGGETKALTTMAVCPMTVCQPHDEVCDGVDNDCDGAIDDGFDRDGDGVTTCQNDCNDTNDAVAPGKTEVCDGQDNNCDGRVDEGVKNACGACGDLPEETCDGSDNNCDGLIDEGCSCDGTERRPCGLGECDGVQACTALGTWGDECTYVSGHGPQPEKCDNLDNDCDGSTDEDFDLGAACHAGEENCRVDGTLVCNADKLASCSAKVDAACVLNVDTGTVNEGTTPTTETNGEGPAADAPGTDEAGGAQVLVPPPAGGTRLRGGGCLSMIPGAVRLDMMFLYMVVIAMRLVYRRKN